MEFRPCIDIHNGCVKQIVGSSINDLEADGTVATNFVAREDAAYFAKLYQDLGLRGGHIIILNRFDSEFYEKSLKQAINALKAYRGGLMVGGGINTDNAEFFLKNGASHVIVTSFVFKDGKIDYHNLNSLVSIIGKEKIVLDLSCRKKNGCYFIVTDRWQKFTDVMVNAESLIELESYCDEFLIHAVDVEGKSGGIDDELVKILAEYKPIPSECLGLPVTYAGGVHDFSDLDKLRILGKNRLNVTIGSALDIFGGSILINDVIKYLAV